ncbi:CrcB family protein [Aeromicrobium panaciterrae]|uniref:fluoride efflux transporter FluC n=1 Tax=Aeromicrobium panaciterrae TaxID=363861 RepID=UPI0031DE042D
MKQLALVFLGGTLGTLARRGVSEIPYDGVFPLATFTVNVVGSFALGALLAVVVRRSADQARLLLGTGFLGGFTTYSALAVETDTLLRGDHVALGLTYAIGTVLAGLVAALAGVALGSRARS